MLYEADADRAAQLEVANLLEVAWSCEAIALPPLSGADFIIKKHGVAQALAEIKCRPFSRELYPSYLIGDRKVLALETAATILRVRPLLVVRWSDAAGWIDVTDQPYESQMGGRRDRADDKDIEPCRFYPIQRFANITKS